MSYTWVSSLPPGLPMESCLTQTCRRGTNSLLAATPQSQGELTPCLPSSLAPRAEEEGRDVQVEMSPSTLSVPRRGLALDHHLLKLLPGDGSVDDARAYTCTITHVYKHTHPHGSPVA